VHDRLTWQTEGIRLSAERASCVSAHDELHFQERLECRQFLRSGTAWHACERNKHTPTVADRELLPGQYWFSFGRKSWCASQIAGQTILGVADASSRRSPRRHHVHNGCGVAHELFRLPLRRPWTAISRSLATPNSQPRRPAANATPLLVYNLTCVNQSMRSGPSPGCTMQLGVNGSLAPSSPSGNASSSQLGSMLRARDLISIRHVMSSQLSRTGLLSLNRQEPLQTILDA
jgi:hypothetical protein